MTPLRLRQITFITLEDYIVQNKRKMDLTNLILFFCSLICYSCAGLSNQSSGTENEWLRGSAEQRFQQIARHLRGFDVAMIETGYRYHELYWAGRDANWGYAEYQLQKIRLTIENALERRPKRAASAETFLKFVLPEVEKTVQARDTALFWNRFGALTSTCNSCHVAEKVEFVVVSPPDIRASTVRLTPH